MAALGWMCSRRNPKVFRLYSKLFLRKNGKLHPKSKRWSHSECKVEVEVGGRPLTFSSGKLARIADGSVVVQYGDTVVLVTAVSSVKPSENNFVPLVVDYREKASAAGRIPHNFWRRELLPNEREILAGRCIDRSVRSLFPKKYFYDTQIVCNLLASDGENSPDVISINGASAALVTSSIPWFGPVGSVRIGDVDGELIVNPTRRQLDDSKLDLVVTSSDKKVVMLEASGFEVKSDRLCEAVQLAFAETQPIIKALKEFQQLTGRTKRPVPVVEIPSDVITAAERLGAERINNVFSNFEYNKLARDEAFFAIRDECITKLQQEFPGSEPAVIQDAVSGMIRGVLRQNVLEKDQRCDGRKLNELRPIDCEVGVFSPIHGSALFTRGETQVFSTLTFGSMDSAKKMDTITEALSGVKEKQFMLHYEFPPFSTNETGRMGGFSRREVGHGSLAEKALRPVIPENHPFTIRLTALVLGSNGSSSMASACAGSLALMDAGVPISRPVAGSACGLVATADADDAAGADIEKYQLLTDILGIEDYMGDMDFKMAGTKEGFTSLQADFKIPGLPLKIVEEAIHRCTEDRLKVLDIMDSAIHEPRKRMRDNMPVIDTVNVPAMKRGKLIGAGGYVIRGLQEETGCTINQISEEEFQVFAPNAGALDEALARIREIISGQEDEFQEFSKKVEVGSVYTGKVVGIRDYGLMLEIFPEFPNVLVHVSELDHKRVSRPDLAFSIGDTVDVKYMGFDRRINRLKFSRKAALPLSFRDNNLEYQGGSGMRESPKDNLHSSNRSSIKDAYRDLGSELEVGEIYTGEILEIRDNGVMVEILPDYPPVFLHISEMDHRWISRPEELGLRIGDKIDVKYMGYNHRNFITFSRKATLPLPHQDGAFTRGGNDGPRESKDVLQEMSEELTVGATYSSKIVDIRSYGLMLEVLPNRPLLLLHISELEHERVERIEDQGFQCGDTVDVKYLGYNSQTKRLLLSRKALLPPSDDKESLQENLLNDETSFENDSVNDTKRTDGTKM